MDSSNSQIIGGCEEECHSSESGWTMYIGDDIYEEEIDVTEEYKGVENGGDFESDDSMISDASSAMAATNTKKLSDVDLKKNSRKGKKIMAVEKNGNEEKKKKDKESTSINVVPAQSGNRVRRNWIGKKK